MKLSYSTAWFAYFMSCAPFLVKQKRASASLHKFINWYCPLMRWVGAKEESSRRIVLSCFNVFYSS